jgi:alkaline phosphatase D
MIWDDHEVSNDYANASAERIVPPEAFLRRRAGAYQAYYEHMPMPSRMAPAGPDMRIHTTLQIGNLATMYLLDQRQYRSPQACPPPGRAGGTSVVPAECAELRNPARTLLGGEQERWLDDQFARSATPWNLLAQQTLMAPLTQPGANGAPSRVRADSWDGYPPARRRLFDSIAGRQLRNPVVLGGDLHAFYVADLQAEPGSPVIASEFVGTSITSQAAGPAYYQGLRAANPHLRHADGRQRGYLRITLTAQRLQADLMGLDDVRRADSGISRQAGFIVEAGRPGPVPA